jgi:glycosyltransferase involved in cell wall biosynthesis
MVDAFEVGGAESQAILLARLLRDQGRYQPFLACVQRRGDLLAEADSLKIGIIHEFPLTSFHDFNLLKQERRFINYIRENQIDVVHPQSFYTNLFAISGAAIARVPVRIAFRGETEGWRTPAQNFVERSSYRLASAIHANSGAVKDYLVAHGVPARKIFTVYNGIDMGRVTPSSGLSRGNILGRLNLPEDDNRKFVTIVANMRHDVKDHAMFLRAAACVHKDVPEACFVLAGEGNLTKGLKLMSQDLGISANSFFIGRCDHVADLLHISDICVLSSKAEGFSNSILEYMAAERPVVATAVGGASEAIVEGVTGYLVESGDDEAMANRILSLLKDPNRARSMGIRGRERVQEKFSDKAQLENTQAMYDQLLEEASRL